MPGDPLSYLRGVKPHSCDGGCAHRSGLPKDEGPPEIPGEPSSGNRGTVPGGSAPTLDPICEDCQDPMSKHDGPGGSNPWLACKHFVEKGPKQ